MEAFITSALLVAVAEIGDKTQLLSFVLAARFPKQAWPIIFGIFVATLLNHFIAASIGDLLAAMVSPTLLHWILAASFFAFAVWALIPDKIDASVTPISNSSVFITTTLLFFMAEMGDKTQLATVALAAQYKSLVAVVMGTTIGMLIANVPAVLLGEALVKKIPLHIMRYIASALFALMGILILFVH
ncbi:MAG: TMEM165/GDT1 family protein [Burkholderiales bacterium]